MNDIKGWWLGEGSFIQISGSPPVMYEITNIDKQLKKVGEFMVTEPKGHKFHAQFFKDENNKMGKDFTIELSESSVSYQYTEVAPDQYIKALNRISE
ncbi:hypothetical protein JOC77_000865 [Peribacillus deserti]|uniref:Uncharacterized protein n=1 Tax=Peribacillus deserti TaxID=673318 RepID=A0ABS2QE68_9BACI|nr:hypothetical protein [Peribacillus deserti]MBM7691460.1 hypothetical protein [Peribacillus deserti]